MRVIKKNVLGTNYPIEIVAPDGWRVSIKRSSENAGTLNFVSGGTELEFRLRTEWQGNGVKTRVLQVGYKTVSRNGRSVSILCGTRRIEDPESIKVRRSLHFEETQDAIKLIVDRGLCEQF